MKRSRNMVAPLLLLLSCLFLFSAQAYESRLGDRGYSDVPYVDNEDYQGRMADRDYSSKPYEVNVDGVDNVFSRDEDCVPVGGMFGSDEGIDNSLNFYYQVETLPIIDGADQLNDEILDNVETSVSKTLLPSLFVDDCAFTERSRQAFQPPHRRLVEMMGLTTNPPDTVLEGVECRGELSNELNECYVVDGTMTLFSSSAVDETFLDGLRTIIRDAMTSGDYNDVDSRIVNVSYREDLGNADPTSLGTTPSGSGDDDSLPVYAWVFIGMGAAALVVALGVGFSRRRKRHHDDDVGSFPEQTSTEPIA